MTTCAVLSVVLLTRSSPPHPSRMKRCCCSRRNPHPRKTSQFPCNRGTRCPPQIQIFSLRYPCRASPR